jgi:hypothetical protein
MAYKLLSLMLFVGLRVAFAEDYGLLPKVECNKLSRNACKVINVENDSIEFCVGWHLNKLNMDLICFDDSYIDGFVALINTGNGEVQVADDIPGFGEIKKADIFQCDKGIFLWLQYHPVLGSNISSENIEIIKIDQGKIISTFKEATNESVSIPLNNYEYHSVLGQFEIQKSKLSLSYNQYNYLVSNITEDTILTFNTCKRLSFYGPINKFIECLLIVNKDITAYDKIYNIKKGDTLGVKYEISFDGEIWVSINSVANATMIPLNRFDIELSAAKFELVSWPPK